MMNVTKISQKMKNRRLKSEEKILLNEKNCFIIKRNNLKSYFEAINLLQKKNIETKILEVCMKIDLLEKAF